MDIVDLGKRPLRQMRARLTGAPVVFHHVPKCGGTSVGRALRKRYLLSQATVKPEESFRAFEAFTGRSDRDRMLVDVLDLREQMMLYLMFQDVRCISLHVRFSEAAYARFHDRYQFITILRDPVARFISHYFYSHDKPQAHGNIAESLPDFLQTPRARRLGASYGEYYSGLPSGSDFASAEAVDAAVANLKKFAVVGRLDDLAGFRRDVGAALGVNLRIGHANKARQPAPARKDVVTDALREEITAICAPDIAIWQRVFG